jgi:hypothetical protein
MELRAKYKALRAKYKALDVSSIVSSYNTMMDDAINRLKKSAKKGRHGDENIDINEMNRQLDRVRKFFADIRSRGGTAAEIRDLYAQMGYRSRMPSRAATIDRLEKYAVERIGMFVRAHI